MAIQKISSTVIGPGAVTSEQIATGAITAADIPDGEITTSKIADGNITSAKMANDITIGGNIQAADYILEGISTNLADTAVGVFIYDTSKDSDGGAWRKRTQHTSWYNEELNTATRGSRREFPAVAVIVAEATKITIYDGDDQDMPMWMVFQPNGILDWPTSIHTRQYVAAVNGQIVTVSEDGGLIFRYIDDYIEVIYGSLSYPITSSRIIADRNKTSTYTTGGGATRTYAVLTYAMNDVAITVLPNAPIDPATGLPTPTIAVATASGTSIIRDDGTVVDVMSGTNAYGVEFTKNNELLHTANDANSTFSIQVRDIPSSDTTASSSRKYNHTGTGEFTTPPISGISNESTSKKLAILPNHVIASATLGSSTTGGKPALNLLQEVPSAPTTGMIAYVASDYNTGWMPGNIKLAALSDTTQETVVSTELVTNGTFDSNVSGFSGTMGSIISWDAGRAKSTAVATEIGISYSLSGLIVGKTYVASCDLDSRFGNSGTFFSWLKNEIWSNNLGSADIIDGVSVKVSTTFVATETSFVLSLVSSTGAISPGEYSYFDNFSVRIADADRSVNNKGLQVFGTVTKNPVATGADLVAYSGFSTSNYLQQPYNNTFPINNSQDFVYSVWFKTTQSVNSACIILALSDFQFGKARYLYTNSGALLLDTYGGGWTPSVPVNDGFWHNAVAIYKSNGIGDLYLDGELVGSDDFNYAPVTMDGNAPLWIGSMASLAGTTPFDGSIALARISATAPSAEQIKKMYEDEKVLFQENSKATLYGTSNAVTALAYDDDTNLLHVGTSSGRSVFQGLRRINNTTDAVSTAISANNGMVAEQ